MFVKRLWYILRMDPVILALIAVAIGLGVAAAISEKLRKALLVGAAVVLGILGIRLLDRLIIRGGVKPLHPYTRLPKKKDEEAAAEKEEKAVEAAKEEAKVPERDIAPDLEKLAEKANRRRNGRKP